MKSSLKRILPLLACILALAAIAFVYFYPDAPLGNTLRQYDTLQGIAIGHEAQQYAQATGETPRWTNSVFSGMPTFQISPSYGSSRWYSWITTVMGLGLPAPANLVFMMMVGFFILLVAMRMRWYVALMGAVAYGLSSYYIILIAAGHIWKFVTLAYIPPTLAGVVLAYRGRVVLGSALAALFAMMQIAANHVQMSYYFLFVTAGFILVYLIKAIRPEGDAAARRHALRRWGVATGALIGAACLAVCANLPNLYNTYEYSKETMRGGHSYLTRTEADGANATTGLDRDYITQYSYEPGETFTLLIPDIRGGASNRTEKGVPQMLTLASLPAAANADVSPLEKQYLEYVSQYFGGPEGTSGPVYVGALICALFLLGLLIVKGPWKWVLLALTVFSILLAWGRNFMWFTNLMIDYIPMYAKFRTVESILVIAQFTMPLLGAMVLQRVFTSSPGERRRLLRPAAWAFGICALLCLLAAIAPGFYGDVITDGDMRTDSMITQSLLAQGYSKAEVAQFSLANPRIYAAVESLREGMVRSDAWRSLIFLLLGAGVTALALIGRLNAAIAGTALAALVLADLFTVNKRYLSHDSFVESRLTAQAPFPMSSTDSAILADTTTHYRVMDIPRFWSPAPSYYHKAIGGYHAAKLTRYQDLIDSRLSHFLDGTADEGDFQVLDMLNARYVITPDGEPMLNDRAMGNAWLVDTLVVVQDPDSEMHALGAIDLTHKAVIDRSQVGIVKAASPAAPGDTIRLTAYAPNRLTYHATTAAPTTAVFSEVYFPWGWKAEIDGSEVPIARVNWLLRAIDLPAGTHTVTMTFDPRSLHTTDTIAIIAIILIYLLTLAGAALSLTHTRSSAQAPT